MPDYSKIKSLQDIRFEKEKLRNRSMMAEIRLEANVRGLGDYFTVSYWWNYLNQKYQIGIQIMNAVLKGLSFFTGGRKKSRAKKQAEEES